MSSMMQMRGDPSNVRVEIIIKEQGLTTTRGIRQGFYFLGRALRQTSKRGIIDGPKTGIVYRQSKTGKSGVSRDYNHQASAPGEYPATFTGTLQRSIWFEVRDRQLVFGAEAPYGVFLELKDPAHGGRLFIERSVKENEANATKFLTRELEKALTNEKH